MVYSYAILDEAYASVHQAYTVEERSALYTQGIKKARWYLRKGYPVTHLRKEIYEVYSLSEIQQWAKGEASSVTAYEVSAHNCACFDARGFGVRITCVHQQIVVLHDTAQRLVQWYQTRDHTRYRLPGRYASR
jgi:hypothetical protein